MWKVFSCSFTFAAIASFLCQTNFFFFFFDSLFTAASCPSRSITRAYYRNSVGGLLLFDITNRSSFQNVHSWLEEARSHVQPHSIVFLLVGHKCDLEAQRQVSQHEAEKLAGAYGMRYVETSARDAINVEKVWTLFHCFIAGCFMSAWRHLKHTHPKILIKR